MDFERYAKRSLSLNDIYTHSRHEDTKLRLQRFQVNTNIEMTSISKLCFSSLNDERYYFPD